jgi:hypothetical protein
MQIHGEIRPLPPGIAVAAQRRRVAGQDTIVVALADITTGLATGKRQQVLTMFCDAVNALLEAPERTSPVTVPLAS